MEIIRGLHNLQPAHRGNVVTIGNFDGVHLGHQAIIKQLKKQAKKYQVPATLMTFHPNPQEYFTKKQASFRKAPDKLTSFYDKMQLLKQYGVDRVFCVPFNDKLAALNANDFIDKILLQGLHAKHLVIGDDFRFGKNRQGDYHLLQEKGKQLGFDVEKTPTYLVDNQRVSSTRIRQSLADANLLKTQELLGRPYHISGKVCHGDKRGRIIGFPTANIRLKQQIAPTNGVYAVKITGLQEAPNEAKCGVANLGLRPTVDGSSYLLEIHLFDFNQNIYGKRISIHFEHFIRPEQKFDDLEALTIQIKQDTETAKNLLNTF
jgi:riboflavin kinase/FMN adenylyltransferase